MKRSMCIFVSAADCSHATCSLKAVALQDALAGGVSALQSALATRPSQAATAAGESLLETAKRKPRRKR